MRLIEPLGLLAGAQAAAALAAGLALPVAGGKWATPLVRLIGPGERTDNAKVIAAGDLPPSWAEAASRLAAPVPDWAGLGAGPSVMGVLNATPDSFSDGGAYPDADAAVAAGIAMWQAGAAIVDVGGESTRPGAPAITPRDEQARVVPVIAGLARAGVLVSVDTRQAATMAAALDAGAHVINDISALAHDPDSLPLMAARDCPIVLMHMRGAPDNMQRFTDYDDVALDVVRELAGRLAAAEAAGIDRARIALDPGIGFAKTQAQNLAVLARLPLLFNLGCAILVGVSRKSFIGGLTGIAAPRGRGPGSLAAGLHACALGASVLRVHEVADSVQAIQVWRALAEPPGPAILPPVLSQANS